MMGIKKRPYYRIQSQIENVPDGEPELYNLEQVEGSWRLSRRGFLATTTALAALLTGFCPDSRVAADNAVNAGQLKSHTDK
ncbi:MAG: twin-arginine translocation signal domain-containing protein, partial [Desulfobacteraceae bacterium]